MRIVFVLAGLGAGGAERVISLISAAWAAQGHDVSIISFEAPETPVYHAFDPKVRLVRLGLLPVGRRGLDGIALATRRLAALRRAFKSARPDVVISFLTKINALSLLAGTGLGIPVVVSERNNPRRQKVHFLWNFVLKRLYGRAARIVMQTEASLECLPSGVRCQAAIIPNPIAVPTWQAAPGQKPILVAVGRLVPQKGFDLLIDAFAKIAAEHPAWCLVIWGEGPLQSHLDTQVASLGLQNRIRLAGLSRPAGSWAREASAFVLPSRFEGFPNVLGEAMAAGLPVAAFDCPYGPREMIQNEHDGLLVADGDIGALAQALGRIMGDEDLRERLGRSARKSVTRFEPARIIEQWDRILAETVRHHASRNPRNAPLGTLARE